MTKGVGNQPLFLYIYNMMKKMEKIELTIHEWKDALKVPSPYRNKKKYFRKEKHKKTWKPEE
jgi:hypothetical protein